MDDYDDSSIHSSPVCMIDESDEQEAEAGPSSSVKEFNIISPCHGNMELFVWCLWKMVKLLKEYSDLLVDIGYVSVMFALR